MKLHKLSAIVISIFVFGRAAGFVGTHFVPQCFAITFRELFKKDAAQEGARDVNPGTEEKASAEEKPPEPAAQKAAEPEKPQPEKQRLRELESKYEVLQSKFDAVKRDRDNILLQTKRLLREKMTTQELEEALNKLHAENAGLINQNNELGEEVKRLVGMRAEIQAERDRFKEEYEKSKKGVLIKDLKSKISALKKENKELVSKSKKERGTLNKGLKDAERRLAELDNLKKKAESKIQDLNSELDESKKDYKEAAVEIKSLKKMLGEVDKLRDNKREANKKIEKLDKELTDYKKDYADAARQNKVLERELEDLPKKFAEIARQNRLLKKETARMHYNLGVLFTKNQKYDRAIVEFEKALETDSNDAHTHFNLGYIYAEYAVDRKKAISHFRRYLQLARSDDEDLEWVRRYLLTWETYEGRDVLR